LFEASDDVDPGTREIIWIKLPLKHLSKGKIQKNVVADAFGLIHECCKHLDHIGYIVEVVVDDVNE
jgi:hypothetical protein